MSWERLLRRAGWNKAPHQPQLAFVYAADSGLVVENVSMGFDPELGMDRLSALLSPEPEWLRCRPAWLSFRWPAMQVKSDRDLLYLALLRAKSVLSARAMIPDSSAADLQAGLDELFPALCQARKDEDPLSFRTWTANVTIGAFKGDDLGWGHCGDGRDGRELPIPNPELPVPGANPNGMSAWELVMTSQLRIDITRRIENL